MAFKRRKVYRHSETDKAILVHPEPLSHEADRTGLWLPKSQVEIISTKLIKNPAFRKKVGAAQYLGTQLTIRVPVWLAKRMKEKWDADTDE